MSKSYMIVYDNKVEDDYSALESELSKYSPFWHDMNRAWIVVTEEDASDIYYRIKDLINPKNRILVIEVKNEHAGWISNQSSHWINRNVKNDIRIE